MLNTRRALIAVLLLALAVFAWLWFTRPRRVDMTAYVPADAIVYAEAESLPEIFRALTSTDSWKELAPAAGVEVGRGWTAGWLSGLVSFTGLGPSEAVVLARAQVAVAVLGFQAAEESDTTLNFSPREAVVAETHTSEWRVKAAVEKLVGDFARRTLGAQSVERREVEGVSFLVWSEPAGGRRLVAAIEGSVAVVGNDEAAVRACLDVRRGARPSLAADEQLKDMRARVGGEGALAFGYAPRGSAAKAVEVLAPAFVGNISQETQVQSVLATVLPQLINQVIGAAGWSARAAGGGIEDRYFLSLPGEIPQRLQSPFAPSTAGVGGTASVLPYDAFQVTLYDFRSPEDAWRGLGAVLSSHVDISRATIITLGLEALLKPYGVERPREFLRACGGELATARLAPASEGKVLVAAVRDRAALREQVLAHLGRGARVERAGDVEILVSNDPENGAAAFAGDYLLLGSEDEVRRSIGAREAGRALRETPALTDLSRDFFDGPAFTRTLTDDRESARAFLSNFGGRGGEGRLEEVLARRGYSLSQTRLAEGGFEKRTRSAFGLFGEVVARAAAR